MAQERILICEDDQQFLQIISHILEKKGYITIQATFGEEALEKIRESRPDLIILDLKLPDMDGLDVCKIIRQDTETKSIPIIMCTVKSTELDTVWGLDVGADDYITKPIVPSILLARVKAVLRRRGIEAKEETKVFQFGAIHLDIEKRVCKVGNKPVNLTAKEFDLLLFLMKNPDKALFRSFVMESVWGYEYFGTSHTLDTAIYNLRKKLEKEGRRIETVQSVGFRFIGAK